MYQRPCNSLMQLLEEFSDVLLYTGIQFHKMV